MRIAQVAPLYESVPPRLYGGTERVVSYLTEALVELGHDVTLFASGDSLTSGTLVPICERSLRLDTQCVDRLAHHILALEKVKQQAHAFDVIHYHIDYLHFPLSRLISTPQLTTLHGRLDLKDLKPIYAEYKDMPVVSISDSQREPLPDAKWLGTVHHGLPTRNFRFKREPGEYLAFLGRISPEKRVDRAIEIAVRAGCKIRIAAKIDDTDRDYFEREIRHLLSHPLVEFIGEIGESEKSAFLGSAKALLFPIDWPEPFGLVMIESMACGTPVIAYRRGSVPEVIENGINGFIVDTINEAVEAVQKLDEVDRLQCRTSFEKRFSAERMARDYLGIYGTIDSQANRDKAWRESRQKVARARGANVHPSEFAPS